METHQGVADKQSRAGETVVTDTAVADHRMIHELILQILSHVPVTAALEDFDAQVRYV